MALRTPAARWARVHALGALTLACCVSAPTHASAHAASSPRFTCANGQLRVLCSTQAAKQRSTARRPPAAVSPASSPPQDDHKWPDAGEGELEGAAWELHASLRCCFARQLLGQMAHVGGSAQHRAQGMTLSRRSAWTHRYGLHIAAAPAVPSAWSAMEEAVQAHVAQGGVPREALLKHLTPPYFRAPPTLGPEGDKCKLTSRSMCSRFQNAELSTFVAQLFLAVRDAHTSDPDIPQVQLSRFDLFHAHLFLGHHASHNIGPASASSSYGDNEASHWRRGASSSSSSSSTGIRLGLLFHTQEYPRLCGQYFPYPLGWCQVGSDVTHDPRAFNKRNLLWYAGTLAAVDAGPGSLSYHQLLWPETRPLRTVYESDLGQPLADVSFLGPPLPHVGRDASGQRLQTSLVDYIYVT